MTSRTRSSSLFGCLSIILLHLVDLRRGFLSLLPNKGEGCKEVRLTPLIRRRAMPERIKGKTLIAKDEGDDAHGVVIKLYSEETNGVISIIEQPFAPGFLLP